MAPSTVTSFEDRVTQLKQPELLFTCEKLNTLQLNITTQCNLGCKHCHVDGGTHQTDRMSHETLVACLKLYEQGDFAVLDITGGAPELHPEYRWFVTEATTLARAKQGKIITRCNLVILTEDGFDDLPALWADLGVELAVSLPSWEERNTDRQRGAGTFERALEGLRLLNAAGYGLNKTNKRGESLVLNVVVNPGGAFLPPPQSSAEREFKQELSSRYDVNFDTLLTITNNPVGRFNDFLEERGKRDDYLKRLSDAFNPATVENMMCRSQVSVRWDGQLFDCDFNQVLNTTIEGQETVLDAAERGMKTRHIRFGDHCYACTAGAGSSCGGATA